MNPTKRGRGRPKDPFKLLLDTFGSQTAIRKALPTPRPTRQAVSLWFSRRVVPRKRAVQLAKAANWTIRPDELRPGL